MRSYRIYYEDFSDDYKDNVVIESDSESDAIKTFNDNYKSYDILLVVDEGPC